MMGDIWREDDGGLAITVAKEWCSHIVFADTWPDWFSQRQQPRFLIADARLDHWVDEVAARINVKASHRVQLSEESKALAQVYEIYEWLGKAGASRDAMVVALGGGVCTDLVGYAASTYLRGVAWAAVPTTLLAQVDAAIGGKVGVNTPWGKNLVGSFHLPELVAIDSRFLSTLPLRQWRAGIGEIVKSALLVGGWLYDALDQLSLKEGEVGDWELVIKACAKIKVDMVNRDLYEAGPRMFLNLGHTIGHALENLLGYGTLTHGEAVGLGTLAALRLSERLLGLSEQVRWKIRDWLGHWGLPVTMPVVEFSQIWEQLHRDKKSRASGLTWVLLERVGEPRLVPNIEPELVRDVLEELRV